VDTEIVLLEMAGRSLDARLRSERTEHAIV